MDDPSFGMMKVTVKLCWTTNRLASSTRGMRWPSPGVGTMATWGGLSFCWVSNSMVGLICVGFVGLPKYLRKIFVDRRMGVLIRSEDFGDRRIGVLKVFS